MDTNIFYNGLKKILSNLPIPPNKIFSSEDCEYGNNIYYSKNCYFCFDCSQSTNSFYLFDCYMCANCGDCDYVVESELVYECLDVYRCYNAQFLTDCTNLRDSSFCFNCTNGNNLFGCANLRNKSFCIFNRQLTEEEYRKQMKKYRSWPTEKILQVLEQLQEGCPLYPTHANFENMNSDYGNYVYFNKNCYLCFDASKNEDCGYLYDSFYNKSSYDMTYSGQNVELSYEIVDSTDLFNCNYTVHSKNCQDSWFLFSCIDVKDSIGCVGLSHKQYCIFNRQFSKEEYEKISSQILQELKNKNLDWNDLAWY